MSTPHRPRRGRHSPILAAVALAGPALSASLGAITPVEARDLQEVKRQTTQPRKIVKLPTRPSQRPHKVRPDRFKARPGADRVRVRPGRYHRHHAVPRVRDYRGYRRHRHGS